MTDFDPARIALPAEDRTLSPATGFTRAHWAAVADHLLLSLRPFFSGSRSRVQLPGITSIHGRDSDGLEGFARSFLLCAFRLRGERGDDPYGFTAWYRDGIVAGTDPANPEHWPRPSAVGQAKVEAASLALGLQLTRPWLWEALPDREQGRVVDWLADALHDPYPHNNWLWFRVTVETFLASVGGPHDPGRIAADLATIESYYRADGWYGDGPLRAFDHYCGWAMHLYPLLWTTSAGAERFGAAALEPVFRGRLSRFLEDYACLIGADGMPLLQGRSLIYRFAAAAPLWMGAVAGVSGGAVSGSSVPGLGVLRRAASGMLRAFLDRGAVDERGLLPVGLLGAWPAMAQAYSGSGSPYWAAKGFLGLLLPAEHAVWTATEEPLPVERADVRRVIRPAGWLVSGTVSDGVVRVVNHGTDHGRPGDRTADSPLYARLGYSTVTIPPLVGAAVDDPPDNTVGALDAVGRSTARTGFERGVIGDDGVAAFAVSTSSTQWVDTAGDQRPDVGSGRGGTVTDGPVLRTASLVRGPWEVRVIRRLAGGGAGRPITLRVSGWPLAGATAAQPVAPAAQDGLVLEAGGTFSALVPLRGEARLLVHEERGTSPLGEITTAPWAEFDGVGVDEVVAVAVHLGRAAPTGAPAVEIVFAADGGVVAQARWASGAVNSVRL